MKWIAPALAYLAVFLGLFVLHSAWAALLGFHAAIIGSLLIARPGIPLSTLLKNSNKKWIALNLLVCGTSGFALFFLWDVFGIANDLPSQVAALGLNARTWLPFIAYFALVNPFVEEYFWRAYLGSATKRLHRSDLLYAGFHALILIRKAPIVSILFAVAALALAGWFWRQVAREEDGGLLAPVLGHMAADLTILLAIYNMAT
ncbi:MAG TPA: CPBP family glutamic-type intramembrane protease [Anaerolineales bacterium]|nr:CPBP family intramembrane metalloprotease [Anaerolineales bacterium]HNQ94762.1 CPBP family glutamic-type intramembrane protease [Anaerolineales bacterium]HNS61927.1 CPBP family glutamic-type intramembrane protease [Anaerolineales bacterium]